MPSPTRFETSYTDAYSPKSSPISQLREEANPLPKTLNNRNSEYSHRYTTNNVNAQANTQYINPTKEMLQQNKELRKLNVKVQDMMKSSSEKPALHHIDPLELVDTETISSRRGGARSPQRENTEYGDSYHAAAPIEFIVQSKIQPGSRSLAKQPIADQSFKLANSEYTTEYIPQRNANKDQAAETTAASKEPWATRMKFDRNHSPHRVDTEYGDRYSPDMMQKAANEIKQALNLSPEIVKVQPEFIQQQPVQLTENINSGSKTMKKDKAAVSEYTNEYMARNQLGPKKFEVYRDPLAAQINKEQVVHAERSKSPGRENTEYGQMYVRNEKPPAWSLTPEVSAVASAVHHEHVEVPQTRKNVVYLDQIQDQIRTKWHAAQKQTDKSAQRDDTEYGQRYSPANLADRKGIQDIYTASQTETEANNAHLIALSHAQNHATMDRKADTEYGQRYSPMNLNEGKKISDIYTSIYDEDAPVVVTNTQYAMRARAHSPQRGDTEYGDKYNEKP